MQNYISSGGRLELTAPTGGVVSGNGYQIGQLFVVAEGDAAEGDPFIGLTEGVFNLPVAAGDDGWTEGQLVYWDAGSGEVTETASGSLAIGYAARAAADADTTAWVLVTMTARADEA